MTMQEAIEQAKKNLPDKCVSVYIYIERGFAYVYTSWPETGAVRNIDMYERIPFEEQLALAVDIANAGPSTANGTRNRETDSRHGSPFESAGSLREL